MKILAISGSVRIGSTNSALLTAIARASGSDHQINLYDGLTQLPVFSPDVNGDETPRSVRSLAQQVGDADGLIFSSPEYARALPGGLKNAIDWLVPREELIAKPICLVHASDRGDDMLHSLRNVLNTVSINFDEDNFLKIPLMGMSSDQMELP